MNESRICIALDFKTKSDVENFLKQFEGESLYKSRDGNFIWKVKSLND